MPPAPAPTQAPRNLGVLDSLALPQVQSSVSPNAYQQFNTQLLGLLKRHQSLGTAPFVNQSLNAQQTQVQRTQASPQGLIGAAPSVQAGARGASVGAVNPTITGANQGMQTFSEQLGSFGNLINFAQQIGQQQQAAKEREQDRAFGQIFSLLQTYGGAAFQGADEQTLSTLEKSAGLPSGFLARIQTITPLSQQISPFQQQQLDLQQQQLAQSQQQFQATQAATQQITPYQQATLDIQREQINQPITVGSGSTIYDPVTEQAKFTAPSTQTQTPFQGADGNYYTYQNGTLVPVRVKLPQPMIESGSGRQVQYADEINPNSFYIEMGTGRNVPGSQLINQTGGQTVSIGGREFDVIKI